MDKRKELKRKYKESPQAPMGVYQIKNNINGKILIGSSLNLSGRSNSYGAKLEFEGNYNKSLKEDLKTHGLDVFSFEILETIDPDEIRKEDWRKTIGALEEKWLDTLQPYDDRGYNSQKKLRDRS